jgi:hypothetical protein
VSLRVRSALMRIGVEPACSDPSGTNNQVFAGESSAEDPIGFPVPFRIMNPSERDGRM